MSLRLYKLRNDDFTLKVIWYNGITVLNRSHPQIIKLKQDGKYEAPLFLQANKEMSNVYLPAYSSSSSMK